MADWLDIREDDEYLISGTITEEEFEQQIHSRTIDSLLMKRFGSLIGSELSNSNDDYIEIEAMIRVVDPDRNR